jgi:hypothetical protein
MADWGFLVADDFDTHWGAGKELGNTSRSRHIIGDHQGAVGTSVDPESRHAHSRPPEPRDLPLKLARVGAMSC